MVVGVVVGPAALGWVSANDNIDLLAQVGISVLLFAVGLKLDVNLVRNLGPVALARNSSASNRPCRRVRGLNKRSLRTGGSVRVAIALVLFERRTGPQHGHEGQA